MKTRYFSWSLGFSPTLLSSVSLSVILGLSLLSCATLKKPANLQSARSSLPLQVRTLTAFSLSQEFQDGVLKRPQFLHSSQLALGKPWEWRQKNAIGAGPQSYVLPVFVSDRKVLTLTLGAGMSLINPQSGAVYWSKELAIGVAAEAWIQDPYVYVAAMDSWVYKFRLSNGEEIWKTKLPVESTGGISGAQGFLYVSTSDDALWALDEKTGQVLWTYRRPTPSSTVHWSLRGSSTPLINNDASQIFIGFSDGSLVSLKTQSGDVVWEVAPSGASSSRLLFKDADWTPSLSGDGRTLYTALVDRDLLAIQAQTGATQWTLAVNAFSAPSLDKSENALYVSSGDASLKKVEAKSSQLIWSREFTQRGNASTPVMLNDKYFAVTWTRSGWSIHSRENGDLIWEDLSGIESVAAPVFDGKRLAILGPRNDLYFYEITFK